MIVVDSRGKKCPQPIIDLSRTLKSNPEADSFHLLSDDIATWSDLIAWSRMTGHSVQEISTATFLIERGDGSKK